MNSLAKQLVLLTIILLTLPGCLRPCIGTDPKCQESLLERSPDEVTCLAYFESWIFDKQKNECVKVNYSGCSPIGFETKEECEKCKCR